MLTSQPPKFGCAESVQHDPFADGRRERHTKLYVAGPMSGYPENNYPAFNEVSRLLRDAGYEVVNPAEFGEGASYIDLMREDIRLMLDCHGVCFLYKWWESTGARNEINIAGVLRMPVQNVTTWLETAAFELS